MRRNRQRALIAALVAFAGASVAQPITVDPAAVAARVAADPEPHALLVRLCDDFGGRLAGSEANAAALARLEAELRAWGLEPERQPFAMPGWVRGADTVQLLAPVDRPLRVAALAYSAPHDAFEAPVVDVGRGTPEEFARAAVAGAVGLVDYRAAVGTRELVRTAALHQLRGLLSLNRVNGGQVLARTSSFDGEPLPLPIYSITQEEGQWLQRLLARGITPRVRMETRSHPRRVESANLVVRLPGRRPETIVVGAHFDSWDLGQGAIDNGLGVAQLVALARSLRGVPLERSIELVWLNGEEQGLWGSRHQVRQPRATPVVLMVNLDMVGVPIGVNALGDDDLVPVLARWNESRGADALPRGVENSAWFGSDHIPYQLAGVRAVTFHAPIDPAVVRYYHDMADTADKVAPELVSQSAAVIASLVVALAQDPDLPNEPRSAAATAELFRRFKLDTRMRAAGYVPPEP